MNLNIELSMEMKFTHHDLIHFVVISESIVLSNHDQTSHSHSSDDFWGICTISHEMKLMLQVLKHWNHLMDERHLRLRE